MVLRTTTNHENKVEMEVCWSSREAVPRCAAPGELGGTLSGQSRERRQAQERKDPQREFMVASLLMPRGLGRLDQEEQLFVGSLSSAGSAKGIETRDHRGRPQAPDHCLLHLARRNLLQRPRRRLLRSPEPRGPAQAINQTARRPGLPSDPGAFSSSRLEVIF